MISEEKSCDCFPCPSRVKVSLPLASFRVFSLSLIFCSLKKICLGVVGSFGIYCLTFELSESVIWFLTLIRENYQLLLFQIFFSFLFSPGTSITYMLYLLRSFN